MQKQLNGLGIRSYAEIADWKPQDVARVATALKIPGRIEQENWIEQAQILDKGGETYYSRRKAKGELPSAKPSPNEGERTTIRVPAQSAPMSLPSAAASSASAPSAAPAVGTVRAPAEAMAGSGPTVAAPVAGAATSAAAAVRAAQAAVAAAAPAAAAVVAATAPSAANVADRAAFAGAPVAAAAATVSDRPIGMARDQLQRIGGVNAEVERLLNVQGVTKYSQIAGWGSADIARFDRLLGFEGRIARENWIEQSQILANGGETAYSREVDRRLRDGTRPGQAGASAGTAATAVADTTGKDTATKSELSSLRSVRSEAYRAPDAATPGTAGRGSDDLKRIRGVGVLIEKKLNSLGVMRYDQVANWTQADIERFSDKLDFKGRIERENWVEQARILSAGGQTEFSRRVDRGEVETSKPKT